ncbi:MAG: hypothetical protein H7Z73_10900 [Candidatus Saccharibacteria bacterium]|nr:hypothetical protein [Moraxellaceae bacterium]
MTKATTRTLFKTIPITNAYVWSTDFAAKERHRSLTKIGKLRQWGRHCHVIFFCRQKMLTVTTEAVNHSHRNHRFLTDYWIRPWRGMFRIFQNVHR